MADTPTTSHPPNPRVQCERCKLESEWTEAFNGVKKFPWFGKRRSYLCPPCWARKQKQELIIWTCLCFGPPLLALALGVILLGRPARGWFNFALWFMLLDFALILPHEGGHALAAWVLGLRVYGVTVGIGPRLKTFQFGRFTLELKSVPFGGLTWTAIPNLYLARIKRFLVCIAGPLANAALVVVVLCCIPESNPVRWFSAPLPKTDPGEAMPLSVVFVLANAWCVVSNLFPYRSTVDGMEVDSDGMGSLHSLFASDESVRQWQIWYYYLESTAVAVSCDYSAAISCCERGLEEYPDETILQGLMAQLRFNSGEFEKAREIYRNLLLTFPGQTGHRLPLLDASAHADMLIGSGERLEEADAFSTECVQTAPWDANYQATRGGVLIALGKLDEGKAVLEQSRKNLTESSGQACIHSFLALASARQGQPEQANRHLAEARKLDPKSVTVAVMSPKVAEALVAVEQ